MFIGIYRLVGTVHLWLPGKMHLRYDIAIIRTPKTFTVCNLSNNKSFDGSDVTQVPTVASEVVNCNFGVNNNTSVVYQDTCCSQLVEIQPQGKTKGKPFHSARPLPMSPNRWTFPNVVIWMVSNVYLPTGHATLPNVAYESYYATQTGLILGLRPANERRRKKNVSYWLGTNLEPALTNIASPPPKQIIYIPRITSTLHRYILIRYLLLPFLYPWTHNERDGVSNNRCFDCLLNHLFMSRSKKTSKLSVTGLCEGISPVIGESSPPPPIKGQ